MCGMQLLCFSSSFLLVAIWWAQPILSSTYCFSCRLSPILGLVFYPLRCLLFHLPLFFYPLSHYPKLHPISILPYWTGLFILSLSTLASTQTPHKPLMPCTIPLKRYTSASCSDIECPRLVSFKFPPSLRGTFTSLPFLHSVRTLQMNE
ncbi:hypothetical protein P691DRAFT_64515 [Macrolepiota fuliginosa MF-IS2]|uniref:Secreted protein n=1 Tax=Macrolepiota fuliginosa MF-IS2 TaxID=1400762 RepID=A0A9P5XM65_9AGAR|nr:hypothetical protein P691DRAFT_64515 [Macrolepiota fuliginosa MF-IS2]